MKRYLAVFPTAGSGCAPAGPRVQASSFSEFRIPKASYFGAPPWRSRIGEKP